MNEKETEIYHVSIPKDELTHLPAATYSGEIILVNTPEETDKAVRKLREEKSLGFDTETKPNFKRGCRNQVALLQLSGHSQCYLFRLCKTGLPDSLKELLEDKSIRKIGLSIHDDFHNLKALSPNIKPDGFIDLQPFVKNFLISDNSLSRIHAVIFGERISKNQQLSNWEAPELKPHQCLYAALDAFACLKIYEYLNTKGFDPKKSKYYKKIEFQNPTPPVQSQE